MSDLPPSSLAPMLQKLELWAPLTEPDRAAILALPHKVRQLRAQEYIVREGDEPTHSCALLSGFAVRHKVAGDGGRQILSIHLKGDVVDLQNSLLGVADHNVQMLTPGVAAYIPVQAINAIAVACPAVGKAMWRETLVEASIFREWILNVGRRDARTRTAHLLCEMALRLKAAGLGSPDRYELPMTQEQLADMLGLTPIHVNRTLKALGAEGFIQRAKRAVIIANWERLAKVGDFDSAYLHLHGLEPVDNLATAA